MNTSTKYFAMLIKSKEEIKDILEKVDSSCAISQAEKDFLRLLKEDPEEEYKHIYIHQHIFSGFRKGKAKSTIYKILFFLVATSFVLSLHFVSIVSYYLFLTAVIFAAQSHQDKIKAP